jgi:CheY-like chemotaxis protein
VYILLIEDDPSAATIAQEALHQAWRNRGKAGSVVVLPTGADAIAHLNNTNQLPTLILADIQTPRLNGLELLALLKSDRRTKMIPVVMLTNSNSKADVREAFRQGCAGYWLKELDYEQLIKDVEMLQAYWERSKSPC